MKNMIHVTCRNGCRREKQVPSARIFPVRVTPQPESLETIRTPNPGSTVHDSNGKVL